MDNRGLFVVGAMLCDNREGAGGGVGYYGGLLGVTGCVL